MTARRVDRRATMPLSVYGCDVASGPDGSFLSVFTEGWPDGRRVHFNIELTPETATQLRAIADRAMEVADADA